MYIGAEQRYTRPFQYLHVF